MRVLTAALAAAAVVLVVSTTVGTGVGAIDAATPSVGDPLEDFTDAIEADVNTSEVERQIHAQINAERRARGLEPLAYRERTAASARDHTTWMARAGQLSHANLDQQYRCEPAGENIAYTYASADIRTVDGDTVNHYGNETAIARGLVRQWMNSPPHRENLLDARFSAEGIGVVVTETDEGERVYATQALCA
jgi:uncharacterized protein YkwD